MSARKQCPRDQSAAISPAFSALPKCLRLPSALSDSIRSVISWRALYFAKFALHRATPLAISLIGNHSAHRFSNLIGTGPVSLEVDSRTSPFDTRSCKGFVVGRTGDDKRYSRAQSMVHASISAVRNEYV